MSSLACEFQPIVEELDFGVSSDEIFAAVHDRPGSFFLDSAQSAGGLGAWSFIGFDPFLVFRSKGDRISIDGEGETRTFVGEPLAELRGLLMRFRGASVPDLPFAGGAVGYFSYELCAQFERIRRTGPDDGSIPDMEFGFYDGFIAFEHALNRSFVVANPVHRSDAETIVKKLQRVVSEALLRRPAAPRHSESHGPQCEPRSNLSKDAYLAAVARIKDYIAAGDVYQVNLTQRFDAPLNCDPHDLYRRLRRESPAPFASYLNLGSLQVVGSSPERFLRIQNRRVETRPIKGTRPRGGTPAEDRRLREELLASKKDRAELLMIVDLERNDLGRVCEFGSVRVDEIYRLESHPTVHHLVADIAGRLRADCDLFGCIRAMFPGGSITGAPKIRAMQIIDEIEGGRRHLYTGAIGYLGFDGNCDLSIAIRTIFCRGDRAWYHVGGGIVWDSDPEAEYQECLDKGRAMRSALGNPAPETVSP